ncbi:MDR family MFS transporter [Tomitella biformata]|uniref:MDR family MFS transporter n=1 Tax=Tomitella biformata TaxID=630403 RepID=UPI0004B3C19B|nr:MDR family MFS transporter [Tomitella biformata]
MRHDKRTPVLFALILSMALVAMDTTIVATAIPQVVDSLGGFSQIGWVFSVYMLAQTVTIPIYGKLADLYGRKPVLIFGIVVFLLGSLVSAMAWSMTILILFRALQGLGAGSIGATVNTVAGDIYSVEERGRVQGYLSSVWGIAAVVAPAIGGLFAEYLTWHWIFLVNLPIGAIALLLIIRLLHEDVERHSHRIDYAGALLVLVSASALILGLLQGGTTWAWDSPASIGTFLVSVGAAIGLVFVERRAAEPILPPHLWARRLPAGSYATTLTAGMMVIGLSIYLPNWAQQVLGLKPVVAGFVLAAMSITWPVASGLSARLYMRVGFRNTALLGTAFAISSGAVFSMLSVSSPVWQPVLGSALMGAGMGLIVSPLLVGLQSTVGWSERGTITGGAMFARFLGQSLGAAVFGAITNSVLRGQHGVAADIATNAATHATFVGLLISAVATALILVTVVPRHFPAHAGQDDGRVRSGPEQEELHE